jgi:ketosteroid isomerase-like protein
MAGTADLIRALLPSPEVDFAHLIRDDEAFTATIAAVGEILDPEVEAAAVWLGEGRFYRGLEGFRRMWLDWLEPWATYHVQVEAIIEEGDRVAVLIRDRGRHRDSDAEVELLAGSVWTVRAGKLARVEFYANREDLFAASGFSPPEPPTARR